VETNNNELVTQLISEGYQLVGSRYYFTGMPGFEPHDYDFLKVIDKSDVFKHYAHTHYNGCCVDQIVKCPVEELLNWISVHNPMYCASLMIPEVAEKLGIDFNKHRELLKPLVNQLVGTKWEYHKIIYDSYVENGATYLTDKQRQIAFNSYRETRKKNKKK
jgi:hypothetical protein